MDALDETYYEHRRFLQEYLKTVWCSLDTGAIEDLKKEYHVDWDANLHITRFIKHLNDGQKQWREMASR